MLMCGCVKKSKIIIRQDVPPQPGEKLLWQSHEKRPEWLVREPEIEGKDLLFTGVSGNFALESDARHDALRDAVKYITRYIGTFARDEFQKIMTSYGVSSEIVNPTDVTRAFEEQLSVALVHQARVKEYYVEKWQAKSGEIYWKVYALTKVPTTPIEDVYKNFAKTQQENMEKEYAKAKDEQAKLQYEKAMNAFKDAEERGFLPRVNTR